MKGIWQPAIQACPEPRIVRAGSSAHDIQNLLHQGVVHAEK